MASRIVRDPVVSGRRTRAAAATALLLMALTGVGLPLVVAQTPELTAPKPTEPEVFTLEGEFVRIAYNNEGFATLGYRMVQEEIGREWMLLSVGITLRKPTDDYVLKREHISIQTPDGKTIPLATQKEYAAAQLRALNKAASMMTDSINYFPANASEPCALRFFADMDHPGQMSYDETTLSWQRACLGRLFFRVPGGIQIGQHWLNIQFAGSKLQVPFRTLTKEDEKLFRKKWQTMKKQHEASMK